MGKLIEASRNQLISITKSETDLRSKKSREANPNGPHSNRFERAKGYKGFSISDIDTSKVINFESMFSGCTNMKTLKVDNWDTRKGTFMTNMFMNCKFLKNIGDVSKWKMSKANDVHSMFCGCKRLENIGDAGQWDVSNVKDFTFIFRDCEKLRPIDLNHWKIHNDVTGKNVRMIISGTSGWKMPDWFFDVRKR